jgi:DNA-binding beta-propeller fold protein YncE
LFVGQGGGNRILVFQLDANGLPARYTADYAIGQPSRYGRKQPVTTTMASRREGAGINGVAYDSVYDRLIARDGNRLLLFDVRPDHMKDGPDAIAVFGQPSFNTRLSNGAVGPKQISSIDGTVLDEKNQRLFATDGSNNRIMIWDILPSHLTETPDAIAVLGQIDASSKVAGAGSAGLNHPGSIYYDDANNRLFVSDTGNNRVVVFDVTPKQTKTGMAAIAVIGQPDFESHDPGIGPDHLSRPARLLHDPSTQRLFVGDGGNRRIVIFNVAPDQLKNGISAVNVLGQDDFNSRAPRTSLRKAVALGYGPLQMDFQRQRLYVTEPIDQNRAMVFDVDPHRIQNNEDAMAVLFQHSPDKIEWKVSQTQETWPRPFLDAADGKLYVAASHPGGNRVSIFDVSGEIKPTGMPSITTIGHFDAEGHVDFVDRPAGSRLNGRVMYPRSVALDPVDHRLFVGDQYNGRVLVFKLTSDNRVQNRAAYMVLGQPDVYTGKLWDISPRNLLIPYGLGYDLANKRLFVGDGWHNRLLVFDADPSRMKTYEDAMYVIGEPDFTTIKQAAGDTGVDFQILAGERGIGGAGSAPLTMDFDEKGQRLFLTDSGNNRVLVYDISPDHMKNGPAAIAVIGQPDFASKASTPPARGSGNAFSGEEGGGGNVSNGRATNDHSFDFPGGVAFDAARNRLFVVDGNNARVLVFDVSSDKLHNGMSAYAVIGQKDFTTGDSTRLRSVKATEEQGRRRFLFPSSLAYDPTRDWLYVTDRGNERTLIFDVSPDKLANDPGAIGVLGKNNFSTDDVTRAEQEELVEPRELVIDTANQRIFQTDAPMSKVVVYDLPRVDKNIEVAAHGMVNYSTTDPWNGRDKPELDKRKEWQATMSASSAAPAALLTYTKTQQFLEPLSERRSRMLISDTTVPAPVPSKSSLFYLDQGEGNDHSIVVSNPGTTGVDVQLRFRSGSSNREATRNVPAGGQVTVLASEAFGSAAGGKAGSLSVQSTAPVATLVLRRTHTSRNEELVMALPPAEAPNSTDGAVVAGLMAGGGYASEVVLINPTDQKISGHLSVYDARTGQTVKWSQPGDNARYEIQPNGEFHLELHSTSYLPEDGYAVAHPNSGASTPSAMGIVTLKDNSLLLSQTTTLARTPTQMAWIPVDTIPDLIRHGETPSKMVFSIANATSTPALLRFTLFDVDGNEHGRYEQIVPIGSQRAWSLADLFNVQSFRGTVRIWSDTPIAISDKRVTTSLRGESVESEMGYIDGNAPNAQDAIQFPAISDGDGIATEMIFINPTDTSMQGQLHFESPAGKPSELVLR